MSTPRPAGSGGSAVVLDPAITRLLDAMAMPPTLRQLGPDDGRTALREAQQATSEHDGVDARFHTAEVGPAGLTGLWVVRPRDASGALAAVFYLHGGRWMFGDADTHAHIIGELAVRAGVAVVVPEYTRTPEARFPVAVEECYATLLWLYDNAELLGLDPKAVALAGDCAGATIAISVAMLAKTRGGPRLRAQLLYYPPTDAACASASHREFGEGYLLSSDEQAWYWDHYCGADCTNPTASPMRAVREELAGLPPTMVVTAEADVVRDEGALFARNLRAAGVEVTALRYLGTVHDFVVLSPLAGIPPTKAAIAQGAWFLAEALNP